MILNRKVLLLNSTYEVLSFISERKAIKLLFKNKVDIISTYPDVKFRFYNDELEFPATLKLKYHIKRRFSNLAFSRKSVFKRDNLTCQYCQKKLRPGQATIDHIIPKCRGGISSFTNCITACYICNNRKGNKTLEQANMLILNKPTVPSGYLYYYSEQECWHDDWTMFFGEDRKL